MQVVPKSLRVVRRQLPRLHHEVKNSGLLSQRDMKIADLVALADANGLPRDTSRDALRKFAGARGIKARNDLFAEVIRIRKSVPNIGDSAQMGEPDNQDHVLRTGGDVVPEQPKAEHESTADPVPDTAGTTGDSGTGPPVPGAAVRSTAPAVQRDDVRPSCPSCGGPIEEQRALAGYDCLACHAETQEAP